MVADSYWKAEKALAALDIEWNTNGKEQVSSASIFEQFDRDITAGVDRATMSLWETLMQRLMVPQRYYGGLSCALFGTYVYGAAKCHGRGDSRPC